VLIPGCLALLDEYAGSTDPIPELRASVAQAMTWLGKTATQEVEVFCVDTTPENLSRGADIPPAARIVQQQVGQHFPSVLPPASPDAPATVIVVANGSAKRSAQAPGHLDPRSHIFDDKIEEALDAGDGDPLLEIDHELARELWMYDAATLASLGQIFATHQITGGLDYRADPYGVRYWVGRWHAVAL
jgi:hypothetical protein